MGCDLCNCFLIFNLLNIRFNVFNRTFKLSYVANGVQNDDFFLLDDSRILSIIKEPQELLIDFLSKFNYHKGLISQNYLESREIIMEEMDTHNSQHFTDFDMSNTNLSFSQLV